MYRAYLLVAYLGPFLTFIHDDLGNARQTFECEADFGLRFDEQDWRRVVGAALTRGR